MKRGGIQTPTPKNKPPEGSKSEMRKEEKEPALQQARHIPFLTHEEATGSPGKDPVPQQKNKGPGVEALLWHLYFRNTRRDPKETGRAQSRAQGDKKRMQQKNKKASALKVSQAGHCNWGEHRKK